MSEHRPSPDRVMVDIETLGLEDQAAIISIGAVRFNRHGLGDTFSRSISLVSCQQAGLQIDADTLDWWLRQGEVAREQLTGGEDLHYVLTEFRDWYGDADEIWANGPSFDCEILDHAFGAVDLVPPWHYGDERCVRTIRSLADVDIEHDGTDHDALDDAVHQARVVAAALDQLDGAQ